MQWWIIMYKARIWRNDIPDELSIFIYIYNNHINFQPPQIKQVILSKGVDKS